MSGFEGYMIRFDTWAAAIRGSDGSDQMKERMVALVRPLCTLDGLLDSFKLGLAMGEFANTLTDAELEDWNRTRRPGGDLNVVPYVRTPRGSVS